MTEDDYDGNSPSEKPTELTPIWTQYNGLRFLAGGLGGSVVLILAYCQINGGPDAFLAVLDAIAANGLEAMTPWIVVAKALSFAATLWFFGALLQGLSAMMRPFGLIEPTPMWKLPLRLLVCLLPQLPQGHAQKWPRRCVRQRISCSHRHRLRQTRRNPWSRFRAQLVEKTNRKPARRRISTNARRGRGQASPAAHK